LAYTTDDDGNVLSESGTSVNNTYAYDAADRLISVGGTVKTQGILRAIPGGGATRSVLGSTRYIQGVVNVGAHVKSASYTYDASDNLVAETGANGFTATVNNLNQLTQVTAKGGSSTLVYDKAGNLLSDGSRTYTWDAENRLLSVTVTATKLTSTFVYDALGRRAAITDGGTTTRYRWCGERICAARTPAGAITARYFSQGEISGTTSRYYATDHLGSVRALMDNTGSAKGTAIYLAYGKPTFTGEVPTFAYAGMFYHRASGLYLTQHRAYDSTVGRWISRDPVGNIGGMNLYNYVSDNPMSGLDPFGLACSNAGNNPFSNPSLLWIIIGTEIIGGGPEDPLADAAVAAEVAAAEGGAAAVGGDLVTVTHFTDAATADAIAEGGGVLNSGTFVTVPGEAEVLSAPEVESTLEIDAGRGAYSATFQTPVSNLAIPENGALTSGGATQYQLINPTPVGPFIRTIP
jgi:RHS repeat-associated protein